MVLESAWLERKPLALRDSGSGATYALYISTGVSVDSGGQAWLEHFDPPREVTYFVDLEMQAGKSSPAKRTHSRYPSEMTAQ